MMTSNPNAFWNKVGNQPDYMAYVYPKRTDEECEEEGRLQAEALVPSLPEKGVFVDYGCGVGRVTKYLRPYAERMIGVDICQRFIELARISDPDSEYCLASELDESDNDSVDLVVSLSVMQHNDKVNQEKIMADIYRLLKPGGKAVIFFASGDAYTESEFVHKFTEQEIEELAGDFTEMRIVNGNLVRYWGKDLAPGSFNEKILIAIK